MTGAGYINGFYIATRNIFKRINIFSKKESEIND
jgi:hypothetical protein